MEFLKCNPGAIDGKKILGIKEESFSGE